jgi:ABC-type lipoprotein release transport system permease subunit
MKEKNIAVYAWRNLWRNRRRTLITLSGIAFGTLLATVSTGFGDRTYGDMINLAARMGGGHVAIQHRAFQENPTLKNSVNNTDEKERLALAVPGVEHAVSRIAGFAMLSTARESVGAYLLGIDTTKESRATLFALDAVAEGSLFGPEEKGSIVIGKKLADRLDAALGSKVVYTLTDKSGEMVTGLGRVSGIIHTGADGFDAAFCLLHIDALREVLGYEPEEATQTALFISDQRQAGEVAAAIQKQLTGDDIAAPWFEIQPELAGFISMKEGGATFFEIVIMILIAAGIFNTLFVSVMERMREFGIMMAVGFSPGQLFRMVMWESLWLALTGLAAGALLTAWPYHHLSTAGFDISELVGENGSQVAGVVMDPVLRVGIFPEHLLAIALAAVAATLLSGLYPAWKAGRVAPVESIKLV